MNILFITGASHQPHMKNLNHFQRVYFLSRFANLYVLCGKNGNFEISAKSNTKFFRSPFDNKFSIFIYSIYWLIRYCYEYKIHVILTEPSVLCLAGYFSKVLKYKLKWVVDVWDIPIRCQLKTKYSTFRTRTLRKVLKLCFLKADYFIVSILPNFELDYFKIPTNKMYLTKNAIWLNNSIEKEPDLFRKDKFDVVCMRSSFSVDSGLDILIKAFINFYRETHVGKLLVVGNIDHHTKSQFFSKSNDLPIEQIHFINHDELMKKIRHSDVCVIPYKNTPDLSQIYPVKLFEYLENGAVVLASDLVNFQSIIVHKENGILFKAGDQRDLEEKLLLIYKNVELRSNISKNAIKSSQQYNCREKNTEIFHKLIELTGLNQ